MSPLAPYARQIAALDARARRRRLLPRAGVDFSSNDYLALAADPAIALAISEALGRGVPAGSGGSRLLRGNAAEHEALEAKAAGFFGAEAALYMANGFAANLAILSALPRNGDLIVADELAHASMHDGIRQSKARAVFVRHNDAQAFGDAIADWRAKGGTGTPWIVAEALYSMDGDRAPVDDLAAIAARHDALMLLDEAHATGVFGVDGRGLAGHLEGAENLVTLHTCGKGLGVEGALVCAPRLLIDMLVNKARPFIFSTAPSPLMAVAVGAALDRIAGAGGEALREELRALIAAAAEAICAPLGLPLPESQILPVIVGEDARTMEIAAACQQAGFDVRGIRPPTVPPGTSRLRLSITRNLTARDIAALAATLVPLMQGQAA
ncbi:8-amino-7-oxononanoate synthase [Sphingobium jiangsuense]|uniref:8-amino-7-oxononanoate synthase n=1 Tax=Sphingobium jiangsuense TaxID=870476 RepID=A0A7W6BGQ4_9SPHN|nr:8-amino-7-oxononanoate synthase [Sphingobium jiangsuense]MBB3924711.1 8-amino-7-oxononanoate synthase [Sphingobium jiangsuense]GLT00438.1 8-amino-7-oxononanoate synthase [Sphingobium jiangsuense]